MSEQPAAIEASLVDVRNVATHKVVRLELHVPAEQAPQVMDLFGWPTMVAPVPVALARLNGSAKEPEPKEQRRWEDLKLSMQAGIRCEEVAFQKFLGVNGFEEAAKLVRRICEVDSRAGLNTDTEAAKRWRDIESQYQAWLRVPE